MKLEDAFQKLTGQNMKEAFHFPTPEDSLNRLFKQSKSKYPLRLLGTGERDVWVSQEERDINFHILGAPGEGKSRFIEYNIRKDIDEGNGLCLLDPSEGGDTARNILSYCEQIGYEKVIYIDPATIEKFDRVPCIPVLKNSNVKFSTDQVYQSLSILFGSKSTDTPRIKRYLGALLRVLATGGLSLNETKHFASYWDSKGYRDAIFDRIYGNQSDVRTLQNVFKKEFTWEQYFSSTINRLDTLWQEPLSLIFSSTSGINFTEAVSKGWVILVNLSPYRMTPEEARLLGIMVVSEVFQAVTGLFNNKWKGRFYLYMDEAGRFLTPQVQEMLHYRKKAGLCLVLAHHDFDQFRDNPEVMTAILTGARIKMMFDTPSYDDRVKMIKQLGYGGDITHLMAAYANKDIPKQHAVIRKHKDTPVRIKIPNVPDMAKVSDDFMQKILSQPFYKSKQEIKDETNARLTPTYIKSDKPRKTPNSAPARTSSVPKRPVPKSVPKDSEQSPDSSPFEPIEI